MACASSSASSIAIVAAKRSASTNSRIHIADGVVTVPKVGVRAVYRVPTLNLDTASAATRRGARTQWGAMVNALPHPLQIVVHGRPVTRLPVLERIKAHGSAPAQDLAAWLGAHLHGAQLVERERYLVVPADNVEQLQDRCTALEGAMRRIGLPLERLLGNQDLQNVLSGFLTPRPLRFGPAIVDVSASDHVVAAGELVRAFDLGKLAPTITTDWLAPLLDGDLPLDVSIDVEPLALTWAKLTLDRRRNGLETSALTPGRSVALEQIAGLRMAYERRQTRPGPCDSRAHDKALAAALQGPGRRGAPLALGAARGVAGCSTRQTPATPASRSPGRDRHGGQDLPVFGRHADSRGRRAVRRGRGLARHFTTAHSRAKNRHMCWYGTSGAGRGYSLRVLLSRERFADGLRIYGIDQDEQQEYAGRFCAYLQGSRVPIRTTLDAEAFTHLRRGRQVRRGHLGPARIGRTRPRRYLRGAQAQADRASGAGGVRRRRSGDRDRRTSLVRARARWATRSAAVATSASRCTC